MTSRPTNDDNGREVKRAQAAARDEMPRREFLRLGAALPLALTPPALSPLSPAADAAPYPPQSPIALAFLAGSHGKFLRSPSHLPSGDPLLEKTGVRLTVRGCCPEHGAERLALYVHFQPGSLDGGEVRVLAFAAGALRLQNGEMVWNESGVGRMHVPVRSNGTLVLSLEHTGSSAAAPAVIRLTTGTAPGATKLRTGTYVLTAPHPVTGRLPLREHYCAAWTPDADAGVSAPDFPHLLLTVEPGSCRPPAIA